MKGDPGDRHVAAKGLSSMQKSSAISETGRKYFRCNLIAVRKAQAVILWVERSGGVQDGDKQASVSGSHTLKICSGQSDQHS